MTLHVLHLSRLILTHAKGSSYIGSVSLHEKSCVNAHVFFSSLNLGLFLFKLNLVRAEQLLAQLFLVSIRAASYHVPTCSRPTSTTSPCLSQRGGFWPVPTPLGLLFSQRHKLLTRARSKYARSSEDQVARHQRYATAEQRNQLFDAKDHVRRGAILQNS